MRDDPAALALRLFRDHGTLTLAEAAQLALPDELITRDGDAVFARYRLDFIEHLYLFGDWQLPAPGETAAILYRAARQFPRVANALDLGCGSGALGLLLAAQADRMIATDIDPQAVELARLNAQVNGIANVECRQGSLFDPVAGEQFELIVSQPPYIPLAAGVTANVFLHGGSRGDELARQLISRLAAHLAPQGRALLFSDWPEPVRIFHPGLRARLFASPPLTTESYARNYGDAIVTHFAALGITGVVQCLAVLEQGSGVERIEVLPHQWSDLRVD